MTTVSFFEYTWPEPRACFWSAPQSHASTSPLHSLPKSPQGPTPPRLDSSHFFSVTCCCDHVLLADAHKLPSGLQNRKGGHTCRRVSVKPALVMGQQAAHEGLCVTPRQRANLLLLELQKSHLFDFLETHFKLMKSLFLSYFLSFFFY